MAILGAGDIHRGQITYEYADTITGEVRAGRLAPATRESFAGFLAGLGTSDVEFAVEGCTGWWFVADELSRAGMTAHVADPAETAGLRGPKKRAKTDRADAHHLRQLLCDGRLPESWIPPPHMIDIRFLGRLYLDLVQDRTAWIHRVHAVVFHNGLPPIHGELVSAATQQRVRDQTQQLDPGARHAIEVGIDRINAATGQLQDLRRHLHWISRHHTGPRAIQPIYGIGPLISVLIWVELGDTRRFSSSRQAVRYAGLDITIYDSADKRSPGHLSRQGPGTLRWALHEAAQHAARRASPDHTYYQQVKARHNSHTVACLSVARKHLRRCHHILQRLGDDVIAPTDPERRPPI